MGTGGTRGARGHGWYINYRRGKGGRHLQGTYYDRESLEHCQDWNDAVLELGYTRVYMNVVMEPKSIIGSSNSSSSSSSSGNNTEEDLDIDNLTHLVEEQDDNDESKPVSKPNFNVIPPLDTLTGTNYRLEIDLATTVMPDSTDNFIRLLKMEENEHGYKGTLLYRFFRYIGLGGGDVLTNTGKTGLAAPYEYPKSDKSHPLILNAEPLRRTILRDPLALWHIPGTLTMLVKRVDEVDSRFIFCTHQCMHMDGIHRAIGKLTPESLAIVTAWRDKLLTRNGLPTSYDLYVTDCGVVQDQPQSEEQNNVENSAAA